MGVGIHPAKRRVATPPHVAIGFVIHPADATPPDVATVPFVITTPPYPPPAASAKATRAPQHFDIGTDTPPRARSPTSNYASQPPPPLLVTQIVSPPLIIGSTSKSRGGNPTAVPPMQGYINLRHNNRQTCNHRRTTTLTERHRLHSTTLTKRHRCHLHRIMLIHRTHRLHRCIMPIIRLHRRLTHRTTINSQYHHHRLATHRRWMHGATLNSQYNHHRLATHRRSAFSTPILNHREDRDAMISDYWSKPATTLMLLVIRTVALTSAYIHGVYLAIGEH